MSSNPIFYVPSRQKPVASCLISSVLPNQTLKHIKTSEMYRNIINDIEQLYSEWLLFSDLDKRKTNEDDHNIEEFKTYGISLS